MRNIWALLVVFLYYKPGDDGRLKFVYSTTFFFVTIEKKPYFSACRGNSHKCPIYFNKGLHYYDNVYQKYNNNQLVKQFIQNAIHLTGVIYFFYMVVATVLKTG